MMFQLTQSSTIPANYYLQRNLPIADINAHSGNRVKFGKRAGKCVPKTITSSYIVSTSTSSSNTVTFTSSSEAPGVTPTTAAASSSSLSFDYDKWLSEMANWPATTVWIT